MDVERTESGCVIPGRDGDAPLVNLNNAWRRTRAKAGLQDVRLHDLSGTAASAAASIGLSLETVGRLLGDTQVATTKRYAFLFDDARGWAPSALHALLQNPIYRGEYIWNRSEWIKDHESGRRRRFERPESEWLRSSQSELTIVDVELWERAQEVRRAKTLGYEWSPGGGLMRTHAGAGHRVRSRHLLSGFLACAHCGRSFHALSRAETYGCGWHRDRGAEVCQSDLRVARLTLEERVLGAVRDRILVPQVVLYATERAMELVAAEIRRDDPGADRARLREIDHELAKFARFAAKTCRVDAAAELYREPQVERAQIAERLGETDCHFDPELVRTVVLERVKQMQVAFAGSDADRRATFRALLGNRRMPVAPHPEHGFQVEGLFELSLETERVAAGRDPAATRMFGSGGPPRNVPPGSGGAPPGGRLGEPPAAGWRRRLASEAEPAGAARGPRSM